MINTNQPFGVIYNVFVNALDDTQNNNIKRTLLHTAIMNNHRVYFETLMSSPDLIVNCVDEEGRTPLHTAAFFGRYDMVASLLERGAASNKRDKKGHTPLHDAVNPIFVELTEQHVQIAELLLTRGAKASMQTAIGFTPLNWMGKYLGHAGVNEERAGHMLRLAKALIINGAKPDESALDTHAGFDNPDNPENLMPALKRGRDGESDNHSCDVLSSIHTPLTWAVSLGLDDIVRLFESELQVNKTEFDQVTSDLRCLSLLSAQKNPRLAQPNSPILKNEDELEQSVYGYGL